MARVKRIRLRPRERLAEYQAEEGNVTSAECDCASSSTKAEKRREERGWSCVQRLVILVGLTIP